MRTFFKHIGGIILLLGLGLTAQGQQNVLRLNGVTVTASQEPQGDLSVINDGNTAGADTWFTGLSDDSIWVQFQLPAPQKASGYQISFYGGASTYGANNILLYASNDGAQWKLVHEESGNLADPVEEAFNNNTAYTYYRFVFKQYVSSYYLDFYEIALYSNEVTVPTLTGTSNIGNQVDLSWDAVLTSTGSYQLEKSLNGTDFAPLTTLDANTTTYSDTGLTQVSTYWYRIRANGAKDTSAFSIPLKVVTASDALVNKPSLTVSPGDVASVANIFWSLASFNTPGTFELEKSTDGVTYTLLQTFDKTVTTYADSTLQRATRYWYRIHGVNYTSVSAYAIDSIRTGSDSLLQAPALQVVASSVSGKVASLSWSLSIALPGTFELERSLNGTNFTLLQTFDKSVTSFTDSTLTHNTHYWYRIRGRNAVSPSPYSTVQEITTKNDSLLVAPVLTATAPSGTQAVLAWNMPGNISFAGSYELQTSTNGTDFTAVGTFPATATGYTQESLTPQTKYWYRIRVSNYVNASPWSAPAMITTPAGTGIPADITDDGGQLFVSAENRDGADATEGSSKLIDNDVYTKFLVYTTEAPGAVSAVYKPKGAYVATGYSISTAGDAPERDPSDWVFEGSNDSTTWVTLDTRNNQLGGVTPRNTTFNYTLANPAANTFRYYRITFLENNGAFDGVRFQVSEWQIFGLDANAPALPTALQVTGTTNATVSLSWKGSTDKPAVRYVLQRSEDGLYFHVLDTLAGTLTTYTDTMCVDSARYYYRLQALGATPTAVSGWSNVATGLTGFTAGQPLTPTGLAVTDIESESVTLGWTNRASSATGFLLQRSVDNNTFTDLLTLPADAVTATDSTVWPATQYYYRVAAVSGDKNSAWSNVVSAITTGFNSAPLLSAPLLLPENACGNSETITMTIPGLVPGTLANEKTQQLTVTNVTGADSASAAFFKSFSFVPAVQDGVATISFTGAGIGSVKDTATLLVTVKDNGGTNQFGTDSVQLPVKVTWTPLVVTISADKDVNHVPRYVSVALVAATNYASAVSRYEWEDAAGIIGSRNNILLRVQPTSPVTYTVRATADNGCTATAQITVTPDEGNSIANVLTPNGDGVNDTWIIWGIAKYPGNNVQVFDRGGRLVYSKKNYSNDWDGRVNGVALEEGAYYYIVDYGNGQKPVSGMLTIVLHHK